MMSPMVFILPQVLNNETSWVTQSTHNAQFQIDIMIICKDMKYVLMILLSILSSLDF